MSEWVRTHRHYGTRREVYHISHDFSIHEPRTCIINVPFYFINVVLICRLILHKKTTLNMTVYAYIYRIPLTYVFIIFTNLIYWFFLVRQLIKTYCIYRVLYKNKRSLNFCSMSIDLQAATVHLTYYLGNSDSLTLFYILENLWFMTFIDMPIWIFLQ